MRTCRVRALLLGTLLLAAGVTASAQESAPPSPAAEEILDRLKRTLDWYQHARQTVRAAREAGVILTAREDEPTIVRVVQRAFDVARAQAVLAEHAARATPPPDAASPPAATSPAARRAERRAKLEAAIRDGTREVERLRERARNAPPGRREALAREAAAAAKRLELERMRLELLTSLQQADVSLAPGDPELMREIHALQETVPEAVVTPAASAASAAPAAAAKGAAPARAAPAPAVAAPPPDTGTWAIMHRLFALQRARRSLSQFDAATTELAADVEREAERMREALRQLSRRLRAVAGNPGAAAPAALDEAAFRRELQTLKLLGAARVPLRAEAALLQRVEGEIRTWQRTVDRESRRSVQQLALGLAGLAVGLGAIALGAVAWRLAVDRYIKDPFRRRLLLRARKIAAAVAVVLVLVFHFTSELTALVAALGFAAAGVAFALQNVILSMAGYFSMMSPSGIRLGDRVSLQGPYGFVHGEVLEIGLVRIRLRELSPDSGEPTGRIVVTPNSVVFTGSFIKHPPAPAKAA